MTLTPLPPPVLDIFCNTKANSTQKFTSFLCAIVDCHPTFLSNVPHPSSRDKGHLYTDETRSFPSNLTIYGKETLKQHPFIQNGQWKNSHLAKDFLSPLPINNSAPTGQPLLICSSNWTGYILNHFFRTCTSQILKQSTHNRSLNWCNVKHTARTEPRII